MIASLLRSISGDLGLSDADYHPRDGEQEDACPCP